MSDEPHPLERQTVHGPRTPAGVVTIRCRPNGPLVVEMPVGIDGEPQRLRVTDHKGQELAPPHRDRAVALCRCGRSKTRPFCDGSHKTLGCWADDEPPQRPE